MDYKFILGQPASPRFLWEAEVFLTNLFSLKPDAKVVMIFDTSDPTGVERLAKKYPIEVHQYKDEREYKDYPASTRPYLFWKYFEEDPSRENGTYFQVETDIIFREIPKIPKLKGNAMIGSDCGGYLDYNYYATRTLGREIIKGFTEIMNISEDLIRETPGAGAQYVYTNPTAKLWWHIYMDSNLLWKFINQRSLAESDVQRWTMEMNSQLYNFAKFGWSVATEPELDFCRPTDDIKMWSMVKILHNAGVIPELASQLFYKGKYVSTDPFNDDLSYVVKHKASHEYVKAIKAVVL